MGLLDKFRKPKPSIPISGEQATEIENTLRSKLHPAVYSFLQKQGLTIHAIPEFSGGTAHMGNMAGGVWDPLRRQVWLNYGMTEGFNPGVLIHEIGHAHDALVGSRAYELSGHKLKDPLPKSKTVAEALSLDIQNLGKGSPIDDYSRPLSVFHSPLLEAHQKNIEVQKESSRIALRELGFSPELIKQSEAADNDELELEDQFELQDKIQRDIPDLDDIHKVNRAQLKALAYQEAHRTAPTLYGTSNPLENYAETFRGLHGFVSGNNAMSDIDKPLVPEFTNVMESITKSLSETGDVPHFKMEDSRSLPMGRNPVTGGFYSKNRGSNLKGSLVSTALTGIIQTGISAIGKMSTGTSYYGAKKIARGARRTINEHGFF